MLIAPTVGRVVWYRPNENDLNSGMQKFDDQPFNAHVVYVWGNFVVNLVVMDHAGGSFIRTSVPLRQESDDAPEISDGERFCEWMPYQIGQAKKHAGETT
jgi:hypothetical protein